MAETGLAERITQAEKALVGLRAANRAAGSGPSARIDLAAKALEGVLEALLVVGIELAGLDRRLQATETALTRRENAAARKEAARPRPDIPPIGLDSFQQRVGAWAEATFPAASSHTKARHLLREAVELCAATMPEDGNPATLDMRLCKDVRRTLERALARPRDPQDGPREAADILLLLLHLAHGSGFSLLSMAGQKFAEVQARDWGTPDAAGVVEHVRKEDGDGT
jgi:hypothetical protein